MMLGGAGPKEMALKIAIASLNRGMAALGSTALEFINHMLRGAREGVLEAVVITGSSTLINEVVSQASIANGFARRVQTLNESHSSSQRSIGQRQVHCT